MELLECLPLQKREHFSFARVFGPSAKFAGQQVGRQHALQDGDVVQIH